MALSGAYIAQIVTRVKKYAEVSSLVLVAWRGCAASGERIALLHHTHTQLLHERGLQHELCRPWERRCRVSQRKGCRGPRLATTVDGLVQLLRN